MALFNEDLNKHHAYLALSDRYNGLDKNLFEAQQNKYNYSEI